MKARYHLENLLAPPVWRFAKTYLADPARRSLAKIVRGSRVPLFWFDIPNWGDALNPYIVRALSGRSAQHLAGFYHDRYLACGSVLGAANARAEVWGSGFIHEGERVIEPPRAIHAVRGPLSRDALLRHGIGCPEVYGDPALLMPRFFNPQVVVAYEVGIVPHYVDKRHPWVAKCRQDPKVSVIDIESGIEDFVRSVKACHIILSSSLHGLICADAYGIPNVWVQFSDNIIGGDFKFRDYRLSIGSDQLLPWKVDHRTSVGYLAAQARNYAVSMDLDELIFACPFLATKLRCQIQKRSDFAKLWPSGLKCL